VKALLLNHPAGRRLRAGYRQSRCCYCACLTATGSRCTVSVPDYSYYGEGKPLCVDPLERCTYRCDVKLERPAAGAQRLRQRVVDELKTTFANHASCPALVQGREHALGGL
jgi:hypothetical protein